MLPHSAADIFRTITSLPFYTLIALAARHPRCLLQGNKLVFLVNLNLKTYLRI